MQKLLKFGNKCTNRLLVKVCITLPGRVKLFPYLKIFWSVVRLYTIFMVYAFIFGKPSSKHLFCNNSVLPNPASFCVWMVWHVYAYIAIPQRRRTTFPSRSLLSHSVIKFSATFRTQSSIDTVFDMLSYHRNRNRLGFVTLFARAYNMEHLFPAAIGLYKLVVEVYVRAQGCCYFFRMQASCTSSLFTGAMFTATCKCTSSNFIAYNMQPFCIDSPASPALYVNHNPLVPVVFAAEFYEILKLNRNLVDSECLIRASHFVTTLSVFMFAFFNMIITERFLSVNSFDKKFLMTYNNIRRLKWLTKSYMDTFH